MTRYSVTHDPFYNDLKIRVNAYLAQSGGSRYAGPEMWTKTAILLSLFVGLGAAVYRGGLKGPLFVGIFALWMFSQFLMTIGIAHDGAHNCYTRDRRTNRLIMRLFDVLGIHSGHWIENHVHAHHSAPNVPGLDSAIESFELIRLHPHTRGNPLLRYQHFYMFGIYAVATLFQVYFLEFVSLAQNLVGFKSGQRSTIAELGFLMAQKMVVLGYSLLLPLMILPNPKSEILGGWLIGHALCGLAIGIIFMTTHLHEATEFVQPDSQGVIQGSYARHILRTTADVAPENGLYTWISGGLNLHVAHHLFPTISQVHLPAMTRIVRQTAKEHGVPYYRYSLGAGIRSHLRLLKKLGNMPSVTHASV